MPKNLILLWCLLLSACVHSRPVLEATEKPPVHAYASEDPNLETIAVVGINDFHGTLLPKIRKLPDGREVKSGGALALASYIQILRQEMKGRVLVVDAGDEWQGTLESNLNKGSAVVEFYQKLGVNVAAVGNHEFDFGLPNLKAQIKKASYPYLAANIYQKKNQKRIDWPNLHPSTLLSVGPYKIGVIGISTEQTPSTTRYETAKPFDFRDALVPVKTEAEALRKQGADIVLVTAHAGTVCDDQFGLKDWKLWSASSKTSHCNEEDEIYRLAVHLPPKLVDGIVAGHTHQIIHHFLGGIPVIQDESYNQYFNIIYFTFNRATHEALPELTRIEGLIPICAETFKGLSHCDTRRLSAKESPVLEQASFHGTLIRPDPAIAAWLKPIEDKTDHYRKEVLAISKLPLSHFREAEGAFGNLMADVLKDEAKSDFSLVNSGGIRTALDAGPITYDGLYRAMPFDNLLNVIRLSGKQVKLLYQIASAGSHGIISFSGLTLTLIPYSREVPRVDLNGDGKLDRWEGKRLVKITRSDGSEIKDDQMYDVATYDFLVSGGDDLFWFMNQIKPDHILRTHAGYTREMIAEHLRKIKVFNTEENPLVNPKHPRVIFTP